MPTEVKQQVRAKIEEHIKWLEPQDKLTRATSGYRGMLSFMDAETPDTHWLNGFFDRTKELDNLRDEDFFATFPELESLRKHASTL